LIAALRPASFAFLRALICAAMDWSAAWEIICIDPMRDVRINIRQAMRFINVSTPLKQLSSVIGKS